MSRWKRALLIVAGTALALAGLWLAQRQVGHAESLNPASVAEALESVGLHVDRTFETHLEAFFDLGRGGSTAYATDLGVIDVAFFSHTVEGRVLVEEVGNFQWRFHGLGKPREVGSNHQLYFIIHRNVVVVVHEEELHQRVQEALNRKH